LRLRGKPIDRSQRRDRQDLTNFAYVNLRLVLGHAGAAGFGSRAFAAERILVVTFTENTATIGTAAIAIPARANLGRGSPTPSVAKTGEQVYRFCRACAAIIRSGLASCARKLDSPAQWMDQARRSTSIAGASACCARPRLDSAAFLLPRQLETGPAELLAGSRGDYWRLGIAIACTASAGLGQRATGSSPDTCSARRV